MGTQVVTLYRLLKGDAMCGYGLDREEVWAMRFDIYVPAKAPWADAPWSIDQERREVQEVQGQAHNWGDNLNHLWHVHWTCPACREEHHTDVESGNSDSGMWGCEKLGGENIFIVSW